MIINILANYIPLLIFNDSNVLTRKLSRHIRPVNVPTQFDYRHDYRKFFDFQAYYDESLAYSRQYTRICSWFFCLNIQIFVLMC